MLISKKCHGLIKRGIHLCPFVVLTNATQSSIVTWLWCTRSSLVIQIQLYQILRHDCWCYILSYLEKHKWFPNLMKKNDRWLINKALLVILIVEIT